MTYTHWEEKQGWQEMDKTTSHVNRKCTKYYSRRQTSRTQNTLLHVGQGAFPDIHTSGVVWFCLEAKILPMQRQHLNVKAFVIS